MPEQKARRAAAKDKQEGKSPSTQAGDFVREEIEHVRQQKHGARSTEQAIAIGLSKARRAGIKVPAGKSASPSTRKKARQDEAASKEESKPSSCRSKTAKDALKHEGHKAASKKSLSSHARKSVAKRSADSRSAAAKEAARTKGKEGRSAAAKKAARTRAKTQS